MCCWWGGFGEPGADPMPVPYLKVLLDLRIAGGLLWRGWICSQSTGILLLAAQRGLPSFQLNLGTGNGVRGHLSIPGWGERKPKGNHGEEPGKIPPLAKRQRGGEGTGWRREERVVTAANKETPGPGSSRGGSSPGTGESPTSGSTAPGSSFGLSRGLPAGLGGSRTSPLPSGTSCRKPGHRARLRVSKLLLCWDYRGGDR